MPEGTKPLLSPQFIDQLQQSGYPVNDILDEVTRNGRSPQRIIRDWTNLPRQQIEEGMFEEDRDVLLPQITCAIENVLEPWKNARVSGDLPQVKVIEIARTVNLSPEKVLRILTKYPFVFKIREAEFQAQPILPEFPNGSLTLTDARTYGLNPKTIARDARTFWWTPRARTIMRSFLDDSKIDYRIKKIAAEKATISFVPVAAVAESQQFNGTQMPSGEVKTDNQTVEDILNWFKERGGRNWLRGYEKILRERLKELASGEEVDFLIWNCVGFGWEQLRPGKYPITTILNNSDTAITYYFKERIRELSEKLSEIGRANIVILLPTNEVFAEELGVWDYTQTTSERETLFLEIIANLKNKLGDLLSDRITIMRWDDYLKQANAGGEKDYTRAGIANMQGRSYTSRERRELATEICTYFTQFNIQLAPTEEVADGQIRYYGMYAGEGVASQGSKIGDKKMVWVNFEEGNVSDSQLKGANGQLAIVTPASQQEIARYYQWKRKILERGRR